MTRLLSSEPPVHLVDGIRTDRYRTGAVSVACHEDGTTVSRFLPR